MLQLTQNLKTGKMKLLEVPTPALTNKNMLVKVHYSLISAGTESSKVTTARKGYLGKAKEKPEQVKQVLDTIKKEGIASTYRKVMNKLDAWAPLGYSCAGEVIEIGSDITGFKIGDYVACAGQDIANHAEIVSVPKNLCAKIPENVLLESAVYTTLGVIALQGIRQADLRIGESCAVIGLGLLGQLTVQMLKAGGINVFGIDINPWTIEKAKSSGADYAFERSDGGLELCILEKTSGYGVDAVIVTAGTDSLDPIELAGRLARKKGKVVIVGAVPTGFSRENYFKKELDLRMSCSYGPGRYDPDYEQKGIDYPYGYVRWTENRNMQAFLKLIAQGKINLDHLTTHQFDFDQAYQAYELILKKSEPYLGILLKYHPEREIKKKIILSDNNHKPGNIKIGFIGAGSFAQTFLLPNVKKYNEALLIGVATASGNETRTVAARYGFSLASGDAEDIYNNEEINTVFIATRHDSHAEFVTKALENGKNVFVEKPLALSVEQLNKVAEVYWQSAVSSDQLSVVNRLSLVDPCYSPIQNHNSKIVTLKSKIRMMVGFNRRFAPHIQKIRDIFKSYPISISYRINAGYIAKDHWTQDPEIGGGRIIGEVCHFVDLTMYLANSKPESVSAFSMETAQNLCDTLVINLKFENGSVATISYFANGSKELQKEYLEINGYGVTAVLNDFKELIIYGKNKKKYKLFSRDKGHRQEVVNFLNSIKLGKPSPIPFEEIYLSSLVPFKIIESIRTGQTIAMGDFYSSSKYLT
ncbi:MAG: bi-domain-containing oxidoreductase [bacterium]|nr:MAG: bi-domain-containing oxidoreductase [bacterium]